MARSDTTQRFEDHTDGSLEDRADDAVHAMLFHFDPGTKNVVSYRFAIDPHLTREGVPEWVTHYHTFPDRVRKALEGLYALASRSEPYADQQEASPSNARSNVR